MYDTIQSGESEGSFLLSLSFFWNKLPNVVSKEQTLTNNVEQHSFQVKKQPNQTVLLQL